MRPIDEFAIRAQDFCAWVESSSGETKGEVTAARRLLAALYAAALDLPSGLSSEEPEPPFGGPSREVILIRLGALPVNLYSTCDPLLVPNDSLLIGDLADDIADTYADLRRGLEHYNRSHEQDAAWSWSHSFRSHWGTHVVGALVVLHAHIHRHELNVYVRVGVNAPSE